MAKYSWAEPYKIKMVELIKMTRRDDRKHAIREQQIMIVHDMTRVAENA